jgi:hypothetical protein
MKETYILKKEGELGVTEIPSGSGQRFGFRKWTWGEKNAVSAECNHVDPFSGAVSYDSTHFNEQLLLKTVFYEKDGKFIPFTIEEIHNMDGQLGERLFQISSELNLVRNIETQNL